MILVISCMAVLSIYLYLMGDFFPSPIKRVLAKGKKIKYKKNPACSWLHNFRATAYKEEIMATAKYIYITAGGR